MFSFLLAGLLAVNGGARVSTVELRDDLPSRGRLGGVSVDARGFIYVSDFGRTVWRISPDGDVEVLDSSLRGASGSTVDAAGNLYQASHRDNRIVRIDRDGNLERFAESPDFDCPNGIAFDPSGYFVVTSFNNGHLVRVSPDGEAETWLEVPEGRNAHVAATEYGLFVTKIESNRIYRIDRAGAVTPFAGTGELGLEGGPAHEATFARPNGIAVSHDGRSLYVNNLDGPWRGSEPTNIILRRIELSR